MKPMCWTHPKFSLLKMTLKIGNGQAAGILEGLWHLTATFNDETGRVPYSAEQFMAWCELSRDNVQFTADDLMSALISSGFVDAREDGLYVHDWEEHMPNYVYDRIRMRRTRGSKPRQRLDVGSSEQFGTIPNSSGLLPTVAQCNPACPPSASASASASERRRIKTPKPPEGSPSIGDELMTKWNTRIEELKDDRLKPIRSITPDRRRNISARMEDPCWRLAFLDALDHLPFSNTDSFTFQPTFDWMVKNATNAQKVAEGNFDASRSKPTNGRASKSRPLLSDVPEIVDLPYINKPFAEMTTAEFSAVQLIQIPIGRDPEYFANYKQRQESGEIE